jgi:hypothetical protein
MAKKRMVPFHDHYGQIKHTIYFYRLFRLFIRKSGDRHGRLPGFLFCIRLKYPLPEDNPLRSNGKYILPKSNRVLPNGNCVLPNGNRVLPNGNCVLPNGNHV